MAKLKLLVIADFPPPPTPADVLYVAPTGTGEGRLCANCIFWDSSGGRCTIHRKNVRVSATMVCGYHVYGEPFPGWVDFPGIEPVEPATSGLVQVGGAGTACGNCAMFRQAQGTAGLCMGVGTTVRDGWKPAQVDAYGCCARWTPLG